MPRRSAAPSSCTGRWRWSRARYPILVLMPTDAAAEGLRPPVGRPRRQGRGAVHRGPTEKPLSLPVVAARPPGHRRDLPDPELLRDTAGARRPARHRPRPAAPPAEGHPHAMTGRTRCAADTVFDGTGERRDHAVVIDGSRHRRGRAAARAAGRDAGPRRCRPGPGWRRALSTCRSMAAATCCSTTRRRRTASPRSPRRIGGSARPGCCRP